MTNRNINNRKDIDQWPKALDRHLEQVDYRDRGSLDLNRKDIDQWPKALDRHLEQVDYRDRGSLDLTGQRKKDEDEGEEEKEEKDAVKKKAEKDKKGKESKVTLSGLLNFIDGLWSASGGERLIVFTTNYVDKLDPALIRRGRMDKHIELSYCSFEAFKVLARNYLNLETHPLFVTIRRLLEETEMTPADVAENLIPKSWEAEEDSCLEGLIEALEEAKKKKAEEEEKRKVEEEEKKEAEEEEKDLELEQKQMKQCHQLKMK